HNPTSIIPKNPTLVTPALGLRPREAAAAIGISAKTLWTLTATGKGPPHIRIGTCVIYPTRDLQRWLSRQAKAANSVPENVPIVAGKCENTGENADCSSLQGTIGGG